MEPIPLTEHLGRWSVGRGPLYVLLANRLRQLIDDGELPPGALLPTDRALARTLAVGRSTVVNAYEQLRADGRVVRRQGSGTRVAGQPASTAIGEAATAPVFLNLLEPSPGVISLACAAPTAPPRELVLAYQQAASALGDITDSIGYYPAGHPGLRRAVAARYTDRGLSTTADQILVTGGGQHALSLLSSALLRPGGHVVVETPTYPGALETFREHGGIPRPLPVGLDGLDALVRRSRPVLIYVIPSNHNPTGATLPAEQRRRIADTAARSGIPLIEDEVLADLTFPEGHQPPSMAGHNPGVISVGSLSKTVWGGLRLGWIRAPRTIVTRLTRLRAVQDLGGNVPAQLAAATLIPTLDRLCRRQAELLRTQHDHLQTLLARHLPEWHTSIAEGGQTLWVRLPGGDGMSFAQRALRHGVAVVPGAGLDATGGSLDTIRLHFVLPPAELTEAVHRLAGAWHGYDPPKHGTRAPAVMAI